MEAELGVAGGADLGWRHNPQHQRTSRVAWAFDTNGVTVIAPLHVLGDEVEDFNLLASCKSIIMANSSWSWWASYLCPHQDKKIIAPKQYYADGVERTKYPTDEGWVII